jgi:hypothetical protein
MKNQTHLGSNSEKKERLAAVQALVDYLTENKLVLIHGRNTIEIWTESGKVYEAYMIHGCMKL